MTIVANGAASELKRIEIDSQVLDSSNYTYKIGSTILTLKKEYLDTLDDGNYVITFVYKEGIAVGMFTVKKDVTTTIIKSNENNPTSSQPQPSKTVKTGIHNPMVLYGGLLVICGCAMKILIKMKKAK